MLHIPFPYLQISFFLSPAHFCQVTETVLASSISVAIPYQSLGGITGSIDALFAAPANSAIAVMASISRISRRLQDASFDRNGVLDSYAAVVLQSLTAGEEAVQVIQSSFRLIAQIFSSTQLSRDVSMSVPRTAVEAVLSSPASSISINTQASTASSIRVSVAEISSKYLPTAQSVAVNRSHHSAASGGSKNMTSIYLSNALRVQFEKAALCERRTPIPVIFNMPHHTNPIQPSAISGATVNETISCAVIDGGLYICEVIGSSNANTICSCNVCQLFPRAFSFSDTFTPSRMLQTSSGTLGIIEVAVIWTIVAIPYSTHTLDVGNSYLPSEAPLKNIVTATIGVIWLIFIAVSLVVDICRLERLMQPLQNIFIYKTLKTSAAQDPDFNDVDAKSDSKLLDDMREYLIDLIPPIYTSEATAQSFAVRLLEGHAYGRIFSVESGLVRWVATLQALTRL